MKEEYKEQINAMEKAFPKMKSFTLEIIDKIEEKTENIRGGIKAGKIENMEQFYLDEFFFKRVKEAISPFTTKLRTNIKKMDKMDNKYEFIEKSDLDKARRINVEAMDLYKKLTDVIHSHRYVVDIAKKACVGYMEIDFMTIVERK